MQSLESIPTYFSDFLGITLEAGQAILSIVVILAVILPIMFLMSGKGSSLTIIIVMLFLTEAFLVGIGWMPFWILIATVAAMALAVASLGTKVVVGE